MMDINANPHTEYLPFCAVSYWDGNMACGRDDAWTHARIECPRGETRLEFGAANKDVMTDTLRALKAAFARGLSVKAREVREALEIEP